MVRLFRGRGRGLPRPPLGRPMRPNAFPPDFLPPFTLPRGGPRRGILRGHPRPGLPGPPLPPPPRMRPPPPRMRPPPMGRPMNLLPPYPIEAHRPIPIPMRPHPMDMSLRRPGRPIPPPIPARHMFSGPPLRPGLRGGLRWGGRPIMQGVKRLDPGLGIGAAIARAKHTQKLREEQEVNKPWVTDALKTEIKKKWKLCSAAKIKKTEDAWQAYTDQKVLVGKMTRTTKLEYIGLHPDADVDLIMYETPKG